MVEFFLHLIIDRGTQSQLALPVFTLSLRIGLCISIDCYQQLKIALIMQIPATSAFDQEHWADNTGSFGCKTLPSS